MADPHSTLGTLPARFWAKVHKTDGCWLWTGCRSNLGYGDMKGIGAKRMRATHASLLITRGESVPPGIHVCHKCDNPSCVNPDHLFLGTAKDNMRDAIRKGRFKFPTPRRGEANNKAELTWVEVDELRAAYASGETISALSRRFGRARSTLREVVMGRNWKRDGVSTTPRGMPTRKLTKNDEVTIVALIRRGVSRREITQRFGVHGRTIGRVETRVQRQYEYTAL